MVFAGRHAARRFLLQCRLGHDGQAAASASASQLCSQPRSSSCGDVASTCSRQETSSVSGDALGGRRLMTVKASTARSVKKFLQEVEVPEVLSRFPELEKVGVVTKKYAVQPQMKFAVIRLGAHQFKVTSDDVIYTEKIKGVEVMDKVKLGRVLLLGSEEETVIGRPFIPGASVLAAIEEQCQDSKVIIFKKKRRKNYRRTKGHRQELTGLRILEIMETPINEISKSIGTPLPQEAAYSASQKEAVAA